MEKPPTEYDYLDPNGRAKGGVPTVEIYQWAWGGCYYYSFHGPTRQADGTIKWERQWDGGFPSYEAALREARKRAGFKTE